MHDMTNARAALLALTALLLAADDPSKDDISALRGVWAVQSATINGLRLPDDPTSATQLTAFDGKEYIQRQGGQILEEGAIEVDATKSPKTIDFVIKKGPDAGKRQLGIYELEGDTFRVCLNAPGASVRPRSFDAGSGSGRLLVVNRRFRP
jgi:uncharacterized protein (TIGR03067 family)